MTMIKKVFKAKGQTETIADAYMKLIALNHTDKYKKQKAAGSLGGASRWGFIELSANQWKSMR